MTDRLFLRLLPALLLLSGCAVPMARNRDWDPAAIPRQSPDAKDVVLLQSNFNCQYFIDGQPLAVGRRVRVGVTRQSHQVVCQPEGYRSKEEYINPPYDPDSAIGFTFMLEDKLTAAAAAAPQPQAAPQEAALPSDVDTPSYRRPQNADDYAVVVGIEKYAGLPDATYAERDAKAMRDHLAAMGYPLRNIVLLTGARATRAGLAKNVETWLPNHVTEKSTVFFYYSGHGAPDAGTGSAFLVPSDGDPEYLADTAYSVKRLYEKLNALKAKRVIVAMDSCFSGAGGRSVLAKGTRPLVTRLSTGGQQIGRLIVFAASKADQISGALDDQRHGLFTYYFLKGLNGAAKTRNGAVTVQSLYDYLFPKVADEAKENNRDQTAQLLPQSLKRPDLIRLR